MDVPGFGTLKNQERQVCDVETRSSVSDTLQLSTVSIQISSKYSDLGQYIFIISRFLGGQEFRGAWHSDSGSEAVVRLHSGCWPGLQESEELTGTEGLLPNSLMWLREGGSSSSSLGPPHGFKCPDSMVAG